MGIVISIQGTELISGIFGVGSDAGAGWHIVDEGESRAFRTYTFRALFTSVICTNAAVITLPQCLGTGVHRGIAERISVLNTVSASIASSATGGRAGKTHTC